MKGGDNTHGLTQASLGPVAHDSSADPAGGGETDPHHRQSVAPFARLGADRAAGAGVSARGGQEVGPRPQAFEGRRNWG